MLIAGGAGYWQGLRHEPATAVTAAIFVCNKGQEGGVITNGPRAEIRVDGCVFTLDAKHAPLVGTVQATDGTWTCLTEQILVRQGNRVTIDMKANKLATASLTLRG